jgi:hypothetical protein
VSTSPGIRRISMMDCFLHPLVVFPSFIALSVGFQSKAQ